MHLCCLQNVSRDVQATCKMSNRGKLLSPWRWINLPLSCNENVLGHIHMVLFEEIQQVFPLPHFFFSNPWVFKLIVGRSQTTHDLMTYINMHIFPRLQYISKHSHSTIVFFKGSDRIPVYDKASYIMEILQLLCHDLLLGMTALWCHQILKHIRCVHAYIPEIKLRDYMWSLLRYYDYISFGQE